MKKMKHYTVRIERNFKEIAWVPIAAMSPEEAYQEVRHLPDETIRERARGHHIALVDSPVWTVGDTPIVKEI